MISSPLLESLATGISSGEFLLVGGIIIIVLSNIFIYSSLLDQLAFGTFPGENGRIAFSSGRDGNAEIYVMNADGSEQINISKDRHSDSYPDWSPDGTKIAFASTRPGNFANWGIWVMNADGTDLRVLADTSANDLDPSWSPDGTRIAFESAARTGGSAVFVMNADGSAQNQISSYGPYD